MGMTILVSLPCVHKRRPKYHEYCESSSRLRLLKFGNIYWGFQ
jgi:hypothetical protein